MRKHSRNQLSSDHGGSDQRSARYSLRFQDLYEIGRYHFEPRLLNDFALIDCKPMQNIIQIPSEVFNHWYTGVPEVPYLIKSAQ